MARKSKDPWGDYVKHELVKKLSGSDRWIYHKLKALGFRWSSGHEGKDGKRTVIFLRLPKEQYDGYGSTDLSIKLGDGYQETTFRPCFQSSIHITRYLDLSRKKNWVELEEFIEFYREHYYYLFGDPDKEEAHGGEDE